MTKVTRDQFEISDEGIEHKPFLLLDPAKDRVPTGHLPLRGHRRTPWKYG